MMRPTLREVQAARGRFDARLATADVCYFVESKLLDEEGQPFTLAPFQRELLQTMCTAKRLVLMKAVEHGGSTLAGAYLLWRLGRDPNLRAIYASRTAQPQGTKFTRYVRQNIEGNPRLRGLFHLEAGEPWGELAICVRRSVTARDPSLACTGIDSPAFGSRVNLLIGDDLTDVLSELSPAIRRATVDKFDSTLLSRVLAGGQVIAIGVPHHREDLLHLLAARPGWQSVTYGAIGEDGAPIWPARWPLARLEEAKRQMGERRYRQMLLCELPSVVAGALFKPEGLARARERAAGVDLPASAADLQPGDTCRIGVDTSTGEGEDSTVITVVVRRASGAFVAAEVAAGLWKGEESAARIVEVAQRWGAPVVVESNGGGLALAQWAASLDKHVEVHPTPTTAQSKWSGSTSVFGLAASFERGDWVVPPGADEVLKALADWTVGAHSPDAGMSLWIAWRSMAQPAGGRVEAKVFRGAPASAAGLEPGRYERIAAARERHRMPDGSVSIAAVWDVELEDEDVQDDVAPIGAVKAVDVL